MPGDPKPSLRLALTRARELVDSELPALFDGLDVGVIVQGIRAEALYANQMALELLSLRRDQVLGVTSFDPSWDVVRPDGTPFPAEERPVSRVLATGEPVLDVVLGVRRGGSERSWILANARPPRSAAGHVTCVVVTLSDISSERRRMSLLEHIKEDLETAVMHRTAELATTVDELQREIHQRKAAETALAENESLYRSVFRAMAEGVAIHDPSGVVAYANPAAERILGLPLERMWGMKTTDPAWGFIRPDGTPLPLDEAENGTVGLGKVAGTVEPFQAILLDLSMPGISGERVLELLRESHPALPVVVLSGYIEDPERVAAANAVLNKPVSSRSLVATLERILGERIEPPAKTV